MNIWGRRLVIPLLALGVLGVIVGMLLPTKYSLSRSLIIKAHPESIHFYVGDLSKWDRWAPWKDEDPSIITTLSEHTTGVGASQTWIGKDGDGSLTLTKSSPTEGIEYDLFFEGGSYRCWAAIHYDKVGENATRVIWKMKGNMNIPIIGGYMAMMMDSMVGNMFDRGLSKLKHTVEQL